MALVSRFPRKPANINLCGLLETTFTSKPSDELLFSFKNMKQQLAKSSEIQEFASCSNI